MKTRKTARWDRKALIRYGVPAVLIPGMLFAMSLGFVPKKLSQFSSYEKNTQIFPKHGMVQDVIDGDTFALAGGAQVRMIGINAPARGEVGYQEAREGLKNLVEGKRVYLEYDRYQDDKYGRVLAWVWVDCESAPTFLPADYMHMSGNASRDGLLENPKGCANGKLVNDRMVDEDLAEAVVYTDRGELKYEKRLGKK
jgi:endonuclease YncB( thermonuclease family)